MIDGGRDLERVECGWKTSGRHTAQGEGMGRDEGVISGCGSLQTR